MLLLGLVAGLAIGLMAGLPFPAVLAAGAAGALFAFALPIPFGLLSTRSARRAVPVDLAAPVPEPLHQDTYERLPLATRNAVIARAVAAASGSPPETVAAALPVMMGRQRISNMTSQQQSTSISAAVAQHRAIDTDQYQMILTGELDMAASACVPRDDRNRARIEQNLARLGIRLDDNFRRMMILDTALPRLGLKVTGLMERAVTGDLDLAFVVGTIRKVGEDYASRMVKIR